MDALKKVRFHNTAVAVRGNDIDTDRIIPSRFLKCVTFDEVGAHAFEDDRKLAAEAGQLHPFDDLARQSARILVVNKNFGCGSSREHAAQSLKRWNSGIQCVIGESFAEIFFGNCLAIGIPCVSLREADMALLMEEVERNPGALVAVDLEKMEVACGAVRVACTMPESARKPLVEGRWDATFDLLEGKPQVIEMADRLPYFNAWR